MAFKLMHEIAKVEGKMHDRHRGARGVTADRQWILNTFSECLEASDPLLRHEPPTGPQRRHEVKFRGWRVQARKRGDVELLSRRGHDIGQRAPAVVRALAGLDTDECILDAELGALDESGRPAFSATGTKRSRHCLTCFDILWRDGDDLRALTLGDRRQQLAEVLAGSTSVLHLVEQFEDALAFGR